MKKSILAVVAAAFVSVVAFPPAPANPYAPMKAKKVKAKKKM